MKHIRVTVTEEYLLPDDWEIIEHPEDGVLCLRGDGGRFLPDFGWAERRALQVPGEPAAVLRACWQSVGDQRGNWFLGQRRTQHAEFRVIP